MYDSFGRLVSIAMDRLIIIIDLSIACKSLIADSEHLKKKTSNLLSAEAVSVIDF